MVKSQPTSARALRSTVQRRVTSTRREMYRQLAPRAGPVSAQMLAQRDARLSELGPGCVYCGRVANTLDHIEPLVRAGMPTGLTATHLDMLPCCGSCNSSKGASTWRDYMKRVKRPAVDHDARVAWMGRYDRWRRRHAQRWPVQDHQRALLKLNYMVDEAHAFMQSMVNETTRAMHGENAVAAHARDTALDWSSIKRQLLDESNGIRARDTAARMAPASARTARQYR